MPQENQVRRRGNPEQSETFRELDVVRDPDGVIARITERTRDGRVSFSLGKEYEQDNQTRQTQYLGRRHIPALRRILDDLEEKLELLEDRTRAARRRA